MKRSRLYLSLCIAIAANFTTGFKASSGSDEQPKHASNLVKQTKRDVNRITAVKSTYGAVILNPTSVIDPTTTPATIEKLTIKGKPKVTNYVYDIYQFRPTVVETSGEILQFTIKNKPNWLRFDTSTGLLEGTPLASNLGEYSNIVISVSNAKQSVDLPSFTITVNPAINIAHKFGRAKQGTDAGYPFYSPANNIIDKNLKTFNRTRGGANAENWVQVELPRSTRVYKVVVKVKKELSTYLKNADVYLSSKPYLGKFAKGDRIAILKGVAEEQVINLKQGRLASYLIIKGKNDSANIKQLALAELEVYGETSKIPVFKKHNKSYLLDKSTSIGTRLSKLAATDYQDDKLLYQIVEDVPFVINTDGAIKVSAALKKPAYRFTVKVSDGVNQASTKISVNISTQKNLQKAIETGDHTLITEEQIYQEINKAYKNALKQCVAQTESKFKNINSTNALNHCRENNPNTAIVRTVNHLLNDQLRFDYKADGACSASLGRVTCDDSLLINSIGENLGVAFMQGARLLKKQLSFFDEKGGSVFSRSNTNQLIKLFVLLGDKYRPNINYPMDKITTNSLSFYKALFADYSVHIARAGNTYQPDLGDYTSNPERLNSKQGMTKTISLKPSKYDEWSSSLLYAAPGKPIKIERVDNSENEVWMRVSMLREGSSRVWNSLQYTRPQFIRSHAVKLERGRTYNVSTPYGGPIMVWSKGVATNPKSFSLRFKGVVQNPVLSAFDENSISQFVDKLDRTDFDWVNIKTAYVELHALKSKMKQAFNHAGSFPYNGNASMYLEELKQYLIINNLNLAGFKGEGLRLNDTVKAWCNSQSLDCESDLHSKPQLQHINSDVHAHCGSGCSGHPYDAAWPILPVAWGDNHEFGHNLQSKRLKIYGNKSLEVSNNIFPLFSNWQYLNDKGLAVHPNLSRPSSSQAFKVIYDAFKQEKIAGSKHPLWVKEGVYEDAGKRLAFYQQLVFVHQSWELFTKLYLIDRLLTDALKTTEKWQANNYKLGFANYTLNQAKSLSGNDFMAVALSKFTHQDHRNFFAMWGIYISEKAKRQIVSNGFSATVPRAFYPVNQDRLTADFPKNSVLLDGPEIHSFSVDVNCHLSARCTGAKFTTTNPDKGSVYFVSNDIESGGTQVAENKTQTYNVLKVKVANSAGKPIIVKLRAAKTFSKKESVAVNDDSLVRADKISLVIWLNPSDNKHLARGETYKVIETPTLKMIKNDKHVGQIIVSINDFSLP